MTNIGENDKSKPFLSAEQIYDLAEANIEKYCSEKEFDSFEISDSQVAKPESWYDIAKREGWLGFRLKKSDFGLLGYFRTSYALQHKILAVASKKYSGVGQVVLPNFPREIFLFFRSEFFRNETLKNGRVTDFFKKTHLRQIREMFSKKIE